MATNQAIKFGQLARIETRTVWENEATDFTPWLAKEKNLTLLADTIGLDLELEESEKSVGRYRADIVCKDTVSETYVLIENQLDSTDHKHLGQLLTYAAGLDAVSIVWIADKIHEEHRAALDWLNDVTAEQISFFGLEIELWQIGESRVAPKFNVVSKPNDWTKSVATSRRQPQNLTPIRQLQLEYWTNLKKHLGEKGSHLKSRKPRPQHWSNFAIGRFGFHMAAQMNTRENCIAVQLIINSDDISGHYNELLEQKAEIEEEVGHTLEWNERPDKKRSDIRWVKPNTNPTNRTDWDSQQIWLAEALETFYKVFSPILKNL